MAMVVGDNESTATKNAGELLAILITIRMRRYDAGRIALKNTIRASLGRNTQQPSWLTNSFKQHQTLTKHNFYLATTVLSIASCL
jgi:hypothetical protein